MRELAGSTIFQVSVQPGKHLLTLGTSLLDRFVPLRQSFLGIDRHCNLCLLSVYSVGGGSLAS